MESAFLLAEWLGTPAWMWLGFLGLVVALLAFDLGLLHRENHEIGVSESLRLSAPYIAPYPARRSSRVYRPRLLRHRAGPYAASAAGES